MLFFCRVAKSRCHCLPMPTPIRPPRARSHPPPLDPCCPHSFPRPSTLPAPAPTKELGPQAPGLPASTQGRAEGTQQVLPPSPATLAAHPCQPPSTTTSPATLAAHPANHPPHQVQPPSLPPPRPQDLDLKLLDFHQRLKDELREHNKSGKGAHLDGSRPSTGSRITSSSGPALGGRSGRVRLVSSTSSGSR